MKQIYDFEQQNPPVLNENMLRQELEKRTVQRQTRILVVAGLLLQVLMLMLGAWSAQSYPAIAVMCLGYVLISVAGSSVIVVVYTRKGGFVL